MTKTERKIYGLQDKKDDEGTCNYGATVIDFTLHPEQIQPEHIVITSPYFRTDERKLQNGKVYFRLTQRQREKILSLRESGMIYPEIALEMGLAKSTIGRVCREATT